ncbi:protein of unknown function DUF303, acetylesterase putative [Flavobacteriaceae bacterium 3519-10]|nr:protein of unknown function DUF303, acetylesterase putative [Flavobacteriaceae bacterium 3519-10]
MKTRNISKLICLSAFILLSVALEAKVKLPALVSDGMVLQRDQPVKIWGTADAGEKVQVKFQNKKYFVKADAKGNWSVSLPAQKAGGPYLMTVNEITLNDILFGDVWLVSGQSNMELPMYRVKPLYEDELSSANNPNIRFFAVPQKYNFKNAQQNLDGGKWEAMNAKTISNFSAVAYFFAKNIHEKYKIPVGIVNASLGGSPIQAWMDPVTLKKYPEYLAEAERWKNDDLIKQTETSERALSDAWYAELNQNDPGLKHDWKNLTEYSDWKTMQIPGSWEDFEGSFDGTVWFKKEITISAENAGKPAFLNLGRIKDADETYINGVKVGNVTYEYPPRWYEVAAGVLKEGINVITVRIINGSGKGEFITDKPYELEIGGQKTDLKGEWKYKVGTKMNRSAPGQTFIRWKPTGLYNAMIHPLINYNIKGALWYQGESNIGKPMEYGDLLTTMITDWRLKFRQPELPVVVVQLANFMEPKAQPQESNWAKLRFEQFKVTQTLPKTGLAVAIDLGEWNDIHPLNKKDVGDRLALQAHKIAYNDNVIADGPVYQSVKFEGNIAVISFKPGTDNFAPVDELKGFAVKGSDGKWVWADAKIDGNKIVVSNSKIAKPVAVRYAWADNPLDANLRNTAGLPASPFTTE